MTQKDLPVCRHRQPTSQTDWFGCSSPLLVLLGDGVSASACAACPVADKEAGPRPVPSPSRVKRHGGTLSPFDPRTPPFGARGPGTHLKSLLETLGFVAKYRCRCDTLAAKMDAWGPEGCREHREEILGHLRQEMTKQGWTDLFGAAWKAVFKGLPLTVEGLLDEALRRAEGNKVPKKTWSYGVTTCLERLDDALLTALSSLQEAGFDKPRLFVDNAQDCDLNSTLYAYETTCRHPRIEVAGNLTLALWELYHRDPHADYYAVFQDDCLACKGLRAYLDSCEYPTQGYWNLYTYAGNYSRCANGYHGWYESDQLGKGAVGLVFDRTTLLTLLGSPELLGRPQDKRRGHKAIDGGIVHALNKEGWKEWVHNPSLLQHQRTPSVQNPLRSPQKNMDAPNWVGDTEDVSAIMRRLKGS